MGYFVFVVRCWRLVFCYWLVTPLLLVLWVLCWCGPGDVCALFLMWLFWWVCVWLMWTWLVDLTT